MEHRNCLMCSNTFNVCDSSIDNLHISDWTELGGNVQHVVLYKVLVFGAYWKFNIAASANNMCRLAEI